MTTTKTRTNAQFELLSEVLGKGSMGTVLKAVDVESGEEVACKRIDKRKLSHQRLNLARLEARLMMRVSGNENVVKPLAIAETERHLYIFMEFVDGDDFCTLLEKNASRGRRRVRLRSSSRSKKARALCNERDALRYFRQMLNAVEHCHQQGVVHRDIKLENFMLDRRTDTVKLTDFGLAEYLYTDRKSAADTADAEQRIYNRFCGSPAFCAPELAAAKPYHGQPVDVWSLGVTLWTMVCGFFPFRGRHEALFHSIINDELDFDGTPKLSAELKQLLRAMLAKDPRERITVDEIRHSAWLSRDSSPRRRRSSLSRFFRSRSSNNVSNSSCSDEILTDDEMSC